jgi:polysaccharide export outer membrane protein
MGGLLLACLFYCLIAPKQYDASAKIALRMTSASSLTLGPAEATVSASILSAPLQQETIANVFRSDQLAWAVILNLRLYSIKSFLSDFTDKFPDFRPETANPAAQAYLLEKFRAHLRVQTVPRTLLIQIRFRSRDGGLSAAVINELIRAYRSQEAEEYLQATTQASAWLTNQLKELKTRGERDQQTLTAFQQNHGILTSPDLSVNGEPGETQHNSALAQIDELEQQLVAATAERILREAEFRAATQGDPEAVLATNSRTDTAAGDQTNRLLEQIHSRRSELDQEQARLNIEHGPNFPRVVEIRHELADLDRQTAAADAKLVERFRVAWQTAASREQALQRTIEVRTQEGMEYSAASSEYMRMRQEANSSHDVYMLAMKKAEEARLAAGIHGTSISVIDVPRPSPEPVTPNLLLYLSLTLFIGFWLALGGAFLQESLRRPATQAIVWLLVFWLAASCGSAQSPPPSAVGFPLGVEKIPAAPETNDAVPANEAAPVWGIPNPNALQSFTAQGHRPSAVLASMPISAGDQLEVSEFHTPEFHAVVHVSSAGTVTLPMIKDVQLNGLDEQAAARAIEAALVEGGMLRHPEVFVHVIGYASQDVSVLGEVAHPGVYPFSMHHRLLDLIAAASGLTPGAGRLVCIFRRADPKTPQFVILDPSGTEAGREHNPELSPGDTVQVSRAGMVYVIGNVVRPGGFPVDPAQGLTVVQALSLAWGPSRSAATGKAVLIREQKGGRTMTTLDLKRMLRGQEPDQAVQDHDILFVPVSMSKNLFDRTLETAIQSVIGVSIYAGLVYSQRF